MAILPYYVTLKNFEKNIRDFNKNIDLYIYNQKNTIKTYFIRKTLYFVISSKLPFFLIFLIKSLYFYKENKEKWHFWGYNKVESFTNKIFFYGIFLIIYIKIYVFIEIPDIFFQNPSNLHNMEKLTFLAIFGEFRPRMAFIS